MDIAPTDPTVFEAVIIPHRSLSRRGMTILAGALGGLTAFLSLRFWLLGAWPVVAFSVVETSLAMFLLWLNTRRGRARELVMLSAQGLTVVRTDMNGRRAEYRLPAAWLAVELTEPAGRVPKLRLRARDAAVEVGAFLGEDEKRDLAQALRAALDGLRHPRFDNPQLRET
jgi:uncharacterized membrane protein